MAVTAVYFLDADVGVLEQAQVVAIHPAGLKPLLLPLVTSGMSATADFSLGMVAVWPTRSRTAGLLSAPWAALVVGMVLEDNSNVLRASRLLEVPSAVAGDIRIGA